MEDDEQQLLWKSESIGKVINTLLTSKSNKLEAAIVKLGEPSKSTLSANLENSLRILLKYVRDAVNEEQLLDEVLIPMIENLLRCKESNHPNQSLILLNWLFQDAALFLPLAKDLVNIISRRGDHYISLGWCRLVRFLVKYETKMSSFSKSGVRDNYQALLKILSSSIEHLSVMVKNGSVLQDGFELPTRLSAAAADCILVLTEALTQKPLDSGNLSIKEHRLNILKKPISILEEKMVDQKNISSAVYSSFDGRLLLWQNLDQLIVLVQKLQSWSQKSRSLHANALGQVLKWLCQIRSNWTQVERGSQFETTGILLLSSCWKHYSMLSLLEDIEFNKRCDELAEQYLSGIEFYSKDNLEDHAENGDSSIETKKFFLNCLALLLGRLDSKKLETTASLYREQIIRVVFAQLQCTDEDVVDVAVCILRFGILNIAGSNSDDQFDTKELLLPLLGILDERDGSAKAVIILIADCCSISSDDWFLKEVLKRLASGSISQRRNIADVISEIIQRSSSNSEKLVSSSFLQEIATQLLNCLGDEDSSIRAQAISLLPLIDPSLFFPALVHMICGNDGTMMSAVRNVFVEVLRRNKNFEVIRMLLDCLSGIYNTSDLQDNSGSIKKDISQVELGEVFRLIPEWSKSVEDWSLLVGPLMDKMLSEPSNAIVVRFLSSVSEHLADSADLVLGKLLVQAQSQDNRISGSIHDTVEEKTCMSDDSDSMNNMLFDRLCPLLIIKVLPLRVFNDFNCITMFGQTLKQCIASGTNNLDIKNYECVATFLFNRAFYQFEFEDVTKLAAELCGRIHPQVLFPVILVLLQHTTESKDVFKMKACLFAICSSLAIRGWDSASHPDTTKIIGILEAILLWPSADGDEVSKVQHGCIDCLALMICAELQAPKSVRGSTSKKSCMTQNVIQTSSGLKSGGSVLSYVINNVSNNEGGTGLSSRLVEDSPNETCITIPFRLCMANVLISTCQKITESRKKAFAKKMLPHLIHLSRVVEEAEVRAACVQVLFSASSHLKLAILPYGLDLLKVSISSLRKESQQERMAGARLMASLMASEDAVIESISGGLLEARSILLHMSNSDPSPQLRQLCHKLLICLTSE